MEGIDGGLHPAVDRRQWRALKELGGLHHVENGQSLREVYGRMTW